MRRGTRVGEAYVAVTADGSGINDDIVDAVRGADDDIDKAGDEQGESYGDHFSSGFRGRLDAMRGKVAKKLTSFLDGEHLGGDAGDDAGNSFVESFGDRMRGMGDSISEQLSASLSGNRTQMRQSLEGTFGDDQADRIGSRFGDRMGESLAERFEDAIAGLSDHLTDLFENNGSRGGVSGNRDDGSSLGSSIGSMFGAGSRNNALNFFGKSLGNIVDLTQKVSKGAFTMFSTFSTGFSQAAEGASLLSRLGSGFSATFAQGGGMLSKLAASGPAAAAAIAIVIVALSVMVSVVGALLGLMTALVSTIVSGLVAGALVGAGALGALAAAGGLAVIAFTSMTNAQQELLANAFQPLKAEITGIGQLMLGQMVPAFHTWSANLQQAFLPLAGYAERFGSAFARAGNIITASFSGPGWSSFITALGTYLPSIITRFSSAFGSFGNGMAAVFAAIMPYVNRFAGYLAAVAARFSAWANSAKGRNAIVDFVDRAVNSLISLWRSVRAVMGFIGDLLFSPQAQKAGNTIFDRIGRTFEGLRRKLAQAAADGSLERWFNSAIEFGSALWAVMKALGKVFMALYNSGVLDAVSIGMRGFAMVTDALAYILTPVIDLIGFALPGAVAAAITPVMTLAASVIAVGEAVEWLGGLVGMGNGAEDPFRGFKDIGSMWQGVANGQMPGGGSSSSPTHKFTMPNIKPSDFSLGDLIGSGNSALNATDEDDGGYLSSEPKEYVNPYKRWAESLIEQGPSIARQIKQAVMAVNKEIGKALREAAHAADAQTARSGLFSTIESIKSQGEQAVSLAQSALSSAASSLAGSTSAAETQKYLRQVKAAQHDLNVAQRKQQKINDIAWRLRQQTKVSQHDVNAILDGRLSGSRHWATLADFAAARARLAVKIEKANEKLRAAIEMRDQYKDSVKESIKTFGNLLTAQAQTIDGVTQALTHTDITKNLEDRLTQIRTFQANLRILLAQGLSNDAYKQLVDAGVEQGGAYAAALVGGGVGAVGQVNDLTAQINQVANRLGTASSDRLYQAGVSAARGLVNGLESLSGRLDAAATRLGNSIARAVRRSLGINSPSTVLANDMDHVGDGAVLGLDRQHDKVGRAADRLASRIAVSPEVAAHASRQGGPAPVSGNDPRFRDLIVHTPTENPEAVAHEVLNEVTGRL